MERKMSSVKHEAEKLDDLGRSLQERVDRGRYKSEDDDEIDMEVERWVRDYKRIKDETDRILNEAKDVGCGCLSITARYSLSKRAKKTTNLMKELRHRLHIILSHSHQGVGVVGRVVGSPPPSTHPIITSKIHEFESRKGVEEDIIASLRSEDVNIVGIYGIHGIGKTTMATKIMNRLLEEQEFEEIVRGHLGQHPDKSRILDEIGAHLKVYSPNEFTDVVKVQKLHARLRCGKKTLVVLNDVWKPFNLLEDFGIPRDSKGCKILLTSRSEGDLRAMNARCFEMQVLSEDDAWFFFREVAGKCADDPELNSIAKEIARGCKGWPIALQVCAWHLIDKKNISLWRAVFRSIKYNPGEGLCWYVSESDKKNISHVLRSIKLYEQDSEK